MFKKIIIILSILFFVINIILWFRIYEEKKMNDISESNIENLLEGKIIRVTGNSMYPLINDNEKVIIYYDYFKKNLVERGDLIIYNFAGSELPIIKIVKVLDSDFIQIKNNRMFVNGEKMVNSVGNEYVFNKYQINMLSLFIDKNNRIPPHSVFIFSDNVYQIRSHDSRLFGAISTKELIAKAKLLKQ